jgi:hypothetical protein
MEIIMNYVQIKIDESNYVGVDKNGVLCGNFPATDLATLFLIVNRDDGKKELLTAMGSAPLCLNSQGQAAVDLAEHTDRSSIFLMDSGDDGVDLQSADGQILGIAPTASATLVSVAEHATEEERGRFRMESQDQFIAALQDLDGCCGSASQGYPFTEGVEPFWNDPGHQFLITNASAILDALKGQVPAERFLNFWKQEDFRTQIANGLRDADHHYQYKGFFYSNHFYDPDIRRNFVPFFLEASEITAWSEALKYFEMSMIMSWLAEGVASVVGENGQIIDRREWRVKAGYACGLALHYLSDLTQPMHAANFTNYLSGWSLKDLRHKGFEDYADTLIQGNRRAEFTLKPETVKPEDLTGGAQPFLDFGDLLHRIAVTSKKTFRETVKDEVDKKYQNNVFDNNWGTEADPAMRRSLPWGQQMAAAAMLIWSKASAPPEFRAAGVIADRDFYTVGDKIRASFWTDKPTTAGEIVLFDPRRRQDLARRTIPEGARGAVEFDTLNDYLERDLHLRLEQSGSRPLRSPALLVTGLTVRKLETNKLVYEADEKVEVTVDVHGTPDNDSVTFHNEKGEEIWYTWTDGVTNGRITRSEYTVPRATWEGTGQHITIKYKHHGSRPEELRVIRGVTAFRVNPMSVTLSTQPVHLFGEVAKVTYKVIHGRPNSDAIRFINDRTGSTEHWDWTHDNRTGAISFNVPRTEDDRSYRVEYVYNNGMGRKNWIITSFHFRATLGMQCELRVPPVVRVGDNITLGWQVSGRKPDGDAVRINDPVARKIEYWGWTYNEPGGTKQWEVPAHLRGRRIRLEYIYNNGLGRLNYLVAATDITVQ